MSRSRVNLHRDGNQGEPQSSERSPVPFSFSETLQEKEQNLRSEIAKLNNDLADLKLGDLAGRGAWNQRGYFTSDQKVYNLIKEARQLYSDQIAEMNSNISRGDGSSQRAPVNLTRNEHKQIEIEQPSSALFFDKKVIYQGKVYTVTGVGSGVLELTGNRQRISRVSVSKVKLARSK